MPWYIEQTCLLWISSDFIWAYHHFLLLLASKLECTWFPSFILSCCTWLLEHDTFPSLATPLVVHPSNGFLPPLAIHRPVMLSTSVLRTHTEITLRKHNRFRPLHSMAKHEERFFDMSYGVLVLHRSHFNSLVKQGGCECAYRSVQKLENGTSRIVPTTLRCFQDV